MNLLSPDAPSGGAPEAAAPPPPPEPPPPAPVPAAAPPPAATIVVESTRTEREVELESELENERAARKSRELRISELEDENFRLKKIPAAPPPAPKKREPFTVLDWE